MREPGLTCMDARHAAATVTMDMHACEVKRPESLPTGVPEVRGARGTERSSGEARRWWFCDMHKLSHGRCLIWSRRGRRKEGRGQMADILVLLEC